MMGEYWLIAEYPRYWWLFLKLGQRLGRQGEIAIAQFLSTPYPADFGQSLVAAPEKVPSVKTSFGALKDEDNWDLPKWVGPLNLENGASICGNCKYPCKSFLMVSECICPCFADLLSSATSSVETMGLESVMEVCVRVYSPHCLEYYKPGSIKVATCLEWFWIWHWCRRVIINQAPSYLCRVCS